MIYKIADLLFDMEPEYGKLKKAAENYLANDEKTADFSIKFKDGFLEKKEKENGTLSKEELEYFYKGVLFSYRLIDCHGFVLHASAVAYNGCAFLFSADSGTGKSTHTANWIEYFGKDKAVIINDDKPAIRESNGKYYVYGTPFSGKQSLNHNISVPVSALCFLYRSEKNEMRKMEKEECIPFIFRHTLCPGEKEKNEKLMEEIDRFLKKVPVFSFGCNTDAYSAKFAYDFIEKNRGC